MNSRVIIQNKSERDIKVNKNQTETSKTMDAKLERLIQKLNGNTARVHIAAARLDAFFVELFNKRANS